MIIDYDKHILNKLINDVLTSFSTELMEAFKFKPPYKFNPSFQKPVAYFSMEFAVHQPLKTYAGGLGFLAGSHMRSAYELKQNVIGVGILWKYGYYDQIRKGDQTMDVLFQEKVYGFLEKTDIRFIIRINNAPVNVTAYYLPPEVFKTAPIFFLSTDLPENDYLARTTCHKLYDSNVAAQMAAGTLLGIGGGKLLDLLNLTPEVYHLNEAHGLPLAFYLYEKYRDEKEVKKHLVFTNHTPEEAGNPKTDIYLLESMGYFNSLPVATVKELTHSASDIFDHTKAAMHLAGISNGVSKMHSDLLRSTWKNNREICPVSSVTNAQSKTYWQDAQLSEFCKIGDNKGLVKRKKSFKKLLFEEVADQTGEIYDENILTLVWARRFTDYKRPDLLLLNFDRFEKLLLNKAHPIQIIWAGKPYPMDYGAISVFDKIVYATKNYSNCSVLVGYELKLSKMLKQGADVWLNTPRLGHEASGTSGMTAAMNGAINFSTPDGWIPEFAQHKHNSFLLPPSEPSLPVHEIDVLDNNKLMDMLEYDILPMYYNEPGKWLDMMKNGMNEVIPAFDSNRLAREYYEKLYSVVSGQDKDHRI